MPKNANRADPYPGYDKLKRVVTIKSRRFMVNKLLQRKQMVLDIHHQHLATPARKLIRRRVMKMYKIKDPNTIVLFGFRSKYGGGKSKGFCLIYDDFKARKRFDYRFRLVRDNLAKKAQRSRKPRKELKNRKKKIVGREKAAAK